MVQAQNLMNSAFEAVEYNAKLRLVEHLKREAYLKKAQIHADVVSGEIDSNEAIEHEKAVFRDFKWKRNAVLKAKLRVDGSIAFSGKSICGECGHVRVCPLGANESMRSLRGG